MANATSYSIFTVGPVGALPGGGDPDYTALATCWAAEKGSTTVAVWMECYAGADLGTVYLTGAGFTPVAAYYVRIYAHRDSRQDGTNSTTQGARINATDATAMRFDLPYTRIEGLRIVLATTGSTVRGILSYLTASGDGGLVKGNCFVIDSVSDHDLIVAAYLYARDITASFIARNNLVYGNNTANRVIGFYCRASSTAANATGTYTLQNNAASRVSTAGHGPAWASGGIIYAAYAGGGFTTTTTVTSTNNAASGNAVDFDDLQQGGGGVENISVTQTYCLSADATADDWGGAGNLVSQTPADVFVNPASDLALKHGSPAVKAGTSLAGSFDRDAIGAARWPVADGVVGWDIGPLSTYTGYAIYRGPDSQAQIDYSSRVWHARPGEATVDIIGLGHDADRTYWYAIRAISREGVEETNTDRVVKVLVDSGGSLVGPEPNEIVSASARAAAAGKVYLDFLYVADGQLGAATGIQVAQIVAGEPDWASPLETVPISGTTRRAGYELAGTWSDGETVRLAIRAVTAAGVGGAEWRLDPVVADAVGPDAVGWLELTQV